MVMFKYMGYIYGIQFVKFLRASFLQKTSGSSFCRDKANDRSSHWRCSVRKGVLRNFAKFTGKNLCQSLFFLIKLILKKRP